MIHRRDLLKAGVATRAVVCVSEGGKDLLVDVRSALNLLALLAGELKRR